MTELFEKSYTPPDEPVDVNDGKQHVNLRFCAFNDGTSNNRVNIQSRLDNTAEYQKDQKKHKKKGDSYESDFTNVAKMEPHVDTIEPPSGYQHILKTYIEGPGTTDNEDDSMVGYGIGLGVTGVRAKVKKGILDVVTKIDKKLLTPEKIVIDLLTLDLFGFSRGAAGARSFIHEALFGDNSIAEQLKERGYTVGKVEVCFVGLYDTVSSHGLRFSNDTATLSLDAIVHAKSVLHLVAADEHRENFSLTDITSAKGNGREIYLPGVHSDVGGSYNDGKPEDHVIFAGGGYEASAARHDRAQLITAGWGDENEIPILLEDSGDTASVTVKMDRKAISNHYSKIPLHIMARAAREHKLVFKVKLDRKEKIPEELTELIKARDMIHAYIDSATSKLGREEQSAYWLNNKEQWLKDLRHKHLHFSAKHEFGLKPRFKDGKRHRQTYDG